MEQCTFRFSNHVVNLHQLAFHAFPAYLSLDHHHYLLYSTLPIPLINLHLDIDMLQGTNLGTIFHSLRIAIVILTYLIIISLPVCPYKWLLWYLHVLRPMLKHCSTYVPRPIQPLAVTLSYYRALNSLSTARTSLAILVILGCVLSILFYTSILLDALFFIVLHAHWGIVKAQSYGLFALAFCNL